MINNPEFFVPGAEPGTEEEAYVALARVCGREPLPIEKRIYSVTFRHDGGKWTATVGKPVTGSTLVTRRSRGKKYDVEVPHTDNAKILAIFPGAVYFAMHEGTPGSKWNNPIYMGNVGAITYFGASGFATNEGEEYE